MSKIIVTPEMAQEGSDAAAAMFDASVRKAMHGLGGCKEYIKEDFPEKFHDIIEDYMEERITSVEGIYVAMQRVKNSQEEGFTAVSGKVY